jgi:hypothetical protein
MNAQTLAEINQHLETYEMEVYVPKSEAAWSKWYDACEKMLGHNLDGDQLEDGYSVDYAYDVFLNGISAEYYVMMIQQNPAYHNTFSKE